MNPNQTAQNLKRKFSLIAQKNSVPYTNENGEFDETWIEKFSGVNDYTQLTNKPSINEVELVGNKTSKDLKIAEFNLYDIKTIQTKTADKGWACISQEKTLPKTNNPIIYNDIKNKYDNCDKAIQTITGITSFSSNQSMNSFTKAMNKYYIIENDRRLYMALDYTSTATLTKVNDYDTICILGTENFLLQFTYNGKVYRLTNNDTAEIYDFGFIFMSNNFNYKIFGNEKYFILWNGGENTPSTLNKTIFVVNDNGTLNTKVYNCNSAEQLCDVIKTNEYYYILTRNGNYNIKVYKGVNLDNLDLLDTLKWELLLDNSSYYNRREIKMFYADGTFAIHKREDNTGYLLYSYNEFENLYALPNNIYNTFIIQHNDEICYMGNNILYSIRLELITGTWTTQNLSGEFIFSYYSQNDLLLVACKTSGYYKGTVYGIGLVKKTYTDTYSINDNDVSISYYLYSVSNTKIITNPVSAEISAVKLFLGYFNYFVLDITNEQVGLPFNSNLWTMMYVGDNYIETSFPEGNATRLLPQAEVITVSSATSSFTSTDKLKTNADYQCGTLTALSFGVGSIDDSQLGTTIKFSSGAAPTTITDSASITWADGEAPAPSANKTCLILIWNKIGFYKEW